MAVSIDVNGLMEATGLDTATATRLLPVATRIVEDYAVSAPSELQDEATIRLSGYLASTPWGAAQSETVGPMTISYQSNDAAAFRNSGAAALLTRYRIRRAGAI